MRQPAELRRTALPETGDPPVPSRTAESPYTLWLGMALLCLGCGMLLWLSVLQSIPVSIAYPMLSLNFVWVTLAGWGIWHEPVARRHWLGVGLIVVGIVILGTSV